MSATDRRVLREWAKVKAAHPGPDRPLWRRIVADIDAFERNQHGEATGGGAPRCPVCLEANGHHRSPSSGRYVRDHDGEGQLW